MGAEAWPAAERFARCEDRVLAAVLLYDQVETEFVLLWWRRHPCKGEGREGTAVDWNQAQDASRRAFQDMHLVSRPARADA